MTSKENQGLLIALIIFVTLTILLSVTTFLFFRKYEETLAAIDTHRAERAAAEAQRRTVEDELKKIKPWIGHQQDAPLSIVETAYNDDEQRFRALAAVDQGAADEFPVGGQQRTELNYRAMVDRLVNELKKRDSEITDHTAKIKQLEAQVASVRAEGDTRIQEHLRGQQTAQADLTKERESFTNDRRNADAAQTAARQTLTQVTESMQKLERESKTEGEKLRDAIVKIENERRAVAEARRKEIQIEFDVPDGTVNWVSQRDRVVYINLGSADQLRPQVTFSVYGVEEGDVGAGLPKGKIEVTRITGPHSAEARIVEDRRQDPIMPRDRIYSPVWHPGRVTHFAIAGFIDINGDGRSDRSKIHELIHLNGGEVDAEVDDSGKRTGRLSETTRYLVLGRRPDETTGQEVIDAYGNIVTEADRLGVPQMNIEQFLDMMGYRADERTVGLGRGASSGDFGPQKRGDSFRERRPPARGGAGAY